MAGAGIYFGLDSIAMQSSLLAIVGATLVLVLTTAVWLAPRRR